MPIAWYPSRYWDWCMSEDEKKRDRKIVNMKNIYFLYLMTRYKNFLNIKFNLSLDLKSITKYDQLDSNNP